jgi:uncharacterized protein YfaA (DUF2138 family)
MLGGMSQIWQHIPAQAAVCGVSGVDWSKLDNLLKTGKNTPVNKGQVNGVNLKEAHLNHMMAGTAAACWYPEQDIAAPLLIAKQAEPEQNKSFSPVFEPIFDWLMGTQKVAQKSDSNPDQTKAKTNSITQNELRQIKHSSGLFRVIERKIPISPRFNPALGYNQQALYFSIDGQLVNGTVLRMANYLHPTLLDATGGQPSLLYVDPTSLMALFDRVAKQKFTRQNNPQLRAAWDFHMPKRIQALSQFSPFILTIPVPDQEKQSDQQSPSQTHRADELPQWYRAQWQSVNKQPNQP